jgi:hypothetical protein
LAGKLGRNFLHNSVGISTWDIVTCIMGLSDVAGYNGKELKKILTQCMQIGSIQSDGSCQNSLQPLKEQHYYYQQPLGRAPGTKGSKQGHVHISQP